MSADHPVCVHMCVVQVYCTCVLYMCIVTPLPPPPLTPPHCPPNTHPHTLSHIPRGAKGVVTHILTVGTEKTFIPHSDQVVGILLLEEG